MHSLARRRLTALVDPRVPRAIPLGSACAIARPSTGPVRNDNRVDSHAHLLDSPINLTPAIEAVFEGMWIESVSIINVI